MNVEDCIKKRFSVRQYKKKTVPWKTLAKIINLARYAPSSGNIQNWDLVVVSEKNVKEEIAKACFGQEWMEDAFCFFVVCNNLSKAERSYGERGRDLYSVQNCALFAYNIMLETYNLGLGSCWVGAFDEQKVTEILELPRHIRPEAVITLGYPDEKQKRKERDDPESFCFFEKYGNKERDIKMLPLGKSVKRLVRKL